jgi:hypothetical protein
MVYWLTIITTLITTALSIFAVISDFKDPQSKKLKRSGYIYIACFLALSLLNFILQQQQDLEKAKATKNNFDSTISRTKMLLDTTQQQLDNEFKKLSALNVHIDTNLTSTSEKIDSQFQRANKKLKEQQKFAERAAQPLRIASVTFDIEVDASSPLFDGYRERLIDSLINGLKREGIADYFFKLKNPSRKDSLDVISNMYETIRPQDSTLLPILPSEWTNAQGFFQNIAVQFSLVDSENRKLYSFQVNTRAVPHYIADQFGDYREPDFEKIIFAPGRNIFTISVFKKEPRLLSKVDFVSKLDLYGNKLIADILVYDGRTPTSGSKLKSVSLSDIYIDFADGTSLFQDKFKTTKLSHHFQSFITVNTPRQ